MRCISLHLLALFCTHTHKKKVQNPSQQPKSIACTLQSWLPALVPFRGGSLVCNSISSALLCNSMCWALKRAKRKNFSTAHVVCPTWREQLPRCMFRARFACTPFTQHAPLDNTCPIGILTTEKYMDSICERMLSAVCWLMTIKKK